MLGSADRQRVMAGRRPKGAPPQHITLGEAPEAAGVSSGVARSSAASMRTRFDVSQKQWPIIEAIGLRASDHDFQSQASSFRSRPSLPLSANSVDG